VVPSTYRELAVNLCFDVKVEREVAAASFASTSLMYTLRAMARPVPSYSPARKSTSTLIALPFTRTVRKKMNGCRESCS
jgi:hypothetical protein